MFRRFLQQQQQQTQEIVREVRVSVEESWTTSKISHGHHRPRSHVFHRFHFLFFFFFIKKSPFIFFIFLFSCFFSVFHFFIFSLIFSYFLPKKVSLLALVSEFNCGCFLRNQCSMEMWCPVEIGRDSWDWVGPPGHPLGRA